MTEWRANPDYPNHPPPENDEQARKEFYVKCDKFAPRRMGRILFTSGSSLASRITQQYRHSNLKISVGIPKGKRL
ncbi:hypothetical protein SCP_0508870 [Sparassis crispa]|uniref:Uncharacterized protein n=1 Tax=Sparassis crispa TaxID=139825 RepID=A0A401GNS9_9APHY|nr:hypothetical protein SCP_0508870 [Sparassis crispa]GBE83830.1 hypothetical protein SCP_0508870 [Sparassis crispa]